ncbi:hypothetical protein ACGFZG_16975 [Streptomyces antibioticus]|uniref:hypothetical protein n=1 Tax=Streptomyces antibioticus TaxID=1890 RepID=UPI0036F7770C
MTDHIALRSATGYTGDLVLGALLRRGVRPTIAGRNPATPSERPSGLNHLTADAATPDDLAKHLRSGDSLITTVGRLAGTLALQRAGAAARSVDIGYFATGFPTLDNVTVYNGWKNRAEPGLAEV